MEGRLSVDRKTHEHLQYESLTAAAEIFQGSVRDKGYYRLIELAYYAPMASMLHTAFEVGLKGLFGKKCITHDLYEIYCNLSSDVQARLDVAFRDIVGFYNIDCSCCCESLSVYLEKTGGKESHEFYRYWALEKRAEDNLVLRDGRCPDLRLYSHMVCFIAEMIAPWNNAYLLSGHISRRIYEAMVINLSHTFSRVELDSFLLRWGQPGSPILALEHAVKCDFEVKELTSDSNRVLAGTYKYLTKQDHETEASAFEYLFRKWGQYVSKGNTS